MSLTEHAEAEMRRAGLFDADADYGGALALSVMELVRVFAAQGHSGFSAARTLRLFNHLASFDILTPLTSNPDEWLDQSEMAGKPMWQSRRKPSVFSTDGGATWYDLNEKKP